MPHESSPPSPPEGFGPNVASDDDWEGVDAGQYRFAPGAETFWVNEPSSGSRPFPEGTGRSED